MMSFIFNEHEVYDAKDLKEKYPIFFHGCITNLKNVVTKRSIPSDVVFYAIETKTGWKPSSAELKKSRIFLEKNWVDENIPKYLTKGITTTSGKTYLPAPSIMELKDEEKLRDDAGVIYEIEVRGERHIDKCYFKASDVEIMLKMKHISGTLQRGTTDRSTVSFEKDKHYQTFIVDLFASSGDTSHFRCPTLFLTYAGLTQLLFTRRHPIADKFRRWATETLFIVKHGAADDKAALASKLLGAELSHIKAFLSSDTSDFPAIYLFIIGQIGDLRKEMKIDVDSTFEDAGLVAKFGFTADLKRRASEHEKTFSKFKGTHICLKYYARIDPEYLSEAEADLRTYFEKSECLITDNEKYRELVVLDRKFMKHTVFDKYKSLGSIYEGRFSDMKLTELTNKHLSESLAENRKRLIKTEHMLDTTEHMLAEKQEIYIETNKRLIKTEHILDEERAKHVETNARLVKAERLLDEKDAKIEELCKKIKRKFASKQ